MTDEGRTPPVPPEGWFLIAPSEVRMDDALLVPDGTLILVGPDLFAPFSVELRRLSWAVRRVAPMAMLRDASAFWRPNTRSLKKYHVEVDNAISACTGNPLAEFTVVPAAEVSAGMRCMRPGCRVRWPD